MKNIKEDILAMLQNGENADDIAQMLVGALNDANDEFAKAKELSKREEEKELAVRQVGNAIYNLVTTFYPDTTLAEMLRDAYKEGVDWEEMVEATDATILGVDQSLRPIMALKDFFENYEDEKPEAGKNNIEAFLKANGLA